MNGPQSHASTSNSRAKEHLRKMSTSEQIAADRANSQLSTGPKTETGKAAAARNSIRHGLASASARASLSQILQRPAKDKSRKAQSGNWLRIAETRGRGTYPQTRGARDGEGTPSPA